MATKDVGLPGDPEISNTTYKAADVIFALGESCNVVILGALSAIPLHKLLHVQRSVLQTNYHCSGVFHVSDRP